MHAMLRDCGDRYPLVLPHFKRRGTDVYFLIGSQPVLQLEPSHIPLFDVLDGGMCLTQLRKTFGPVAEVLSQWTLRHLIAWLPSAKPSSAGTPLLVLEPHMDDAVLSVGGVLVRRANVDRITVLSMVRWSTFTSYEYSGRTEFSNIDVVTALRLNESKIAAQSLHAQHVCLDEYDAPLLCFVRSDGTIDRRGIESLQHEDPATCQDRKDRWIARNTLGLCPDDRRRVGALLRRQVERLRPRQVWLPLGVGHPDHVKLRRAFMAELMNDRRWLGDAELFMYDDLPYTHRFQEATAKIIAALDQAGFILERQVEDISDVLGHKAALMAIYASQWKLDHMLPRIPRVEVLTRIRLPPDDLAVYE